MSAPEGSETLYAFDAAWILERGSCGPLAGADEAGRGAFAGPIFASAVVFDGRVVDGVKDSKRLGPAVRELLFSEVLSAAKAVSVVSFPAWWIDRHGVGEANREALSRALSLVEGEAGCLLADGNLRLGGGIESLPRADSKSAAVASASIVAKVLRDHAMSSLSECYPGYGFERNRGYGTAEHRRVLQEVGPCRVHRFSYAGVG